MNYSFFCSICFCLCKNLGDLVFDDAGGSVWQRWATGVGGGGGGVGVGGGGGFLGGVGQRWVTVGDSVM
ncbi:hypothetical protein HanIR_Chr12g0615281 [Helianthus annuus]|nr:hypothetical protein HanIR_Chr12g0615281 [Helianthus annuus]